MCTTRSDFTGEIYLILALIWATNLPIIIHSEVSNAIFIIIFICNWVTFILHAVRNTLK